MYKNKFCEIEYTFNIVKTFFHLFLLNIFRYERTTEPAVQKKAIKNVQFCWKTENIFGTESSFCNQLFREIRLHAYNIKRRPKNCYRFNLALRKDVQNPISFNGGSCDFYLRPYLSKDFLLLYV